MILPSKETLKRAVLRAVSVAITGALSGFVIVPVALEEPKKYATVLLLAMLTGALVGLQKYIKGYIKYDKK